MDYMLAFISNWGESENFLRTTMHNPNLIMTGVHSKQNTQNNEAVTLPSQQKYGKISDSILVSLPCHYNAPQAETVLGDWKSILM